MSGVDFSLGGTASGRRSWRSKLRPAPGGSTPTRSSQPSAARLHANEPRAGSLRGHSLVRWARHPIRSPTLSGAQAIPRCGRSRDWPTPSICGRASFSRASRRAREPAPPSRRFPSRFQTGRRRDPIQLAHADPTLLSAFEPLGAMPARSSAIGLQSRTGLVDPGPSPALRLTCLSASAASPPHALPLPVRFALHRPLESARMSRSLCPLVLAPLASCTTPAPAGSSET